MSETRLRGRCHCGDVRFDLPANAAGVIACHCDDCRKLHGNYNPMIAARRSEVQFQSDAGLVWYASSEKARRGFCGRCGAGLFKDNLGGDQLLVSAGAIEGPTGKTITRNLWEQSKGDWYDLPRPRYSGASQ